MLQHSLEKKRKFEKWKARSFALKFFTLALVTIFLGYIFAFIVQPNKQSSGEMVAAILNNENHLFIVLFLGGLYGGIRYINKKKDEAEDKYHAIRCEIIDKSKDLWKEPVQWRERQHVFEMMKREFDINLFHESK